MNANLPVELNDIILPEAANAWPPALGWWLLLLLLVVLIIGFIWAYHNYLSHWIYRKQALRTLKATYQQSEKVAPEKTIQAINALLKQVALTTYSRTVVGALYGKKWVDFLQQQTSKPIFTKDIAKLLEINQYQPQVTADITQLYQQSCRWIKKHSNKITGEISC